MTNDADPAPIRVLVADDHSIVRAAFASLIKELGAVVVGESETTSTVVPAYLELKPDVVILDIRFGEDQSGLDVAEALLQADPAARIVFLSQFEQDTVITRAYRIGGMAYLTKDCEPSDLRAAIQHAAAGQAYYTPKVSKLIAELHIHGDQSPMALLSKRDLHIFKLLACSMTVGEIAKEMDLAEKTVSNASLAIKKALNASRTADLTRLAIRHGLIEA